MGGPDGSSPPAGGNGSPRSASSRATSRRRASEVKAAKVSPGVESTVARAAARRPAGRSTVRRSRPPGLAPSARRHPGPALLRLPWRRLGSRCGRLRLLGRQPRSPAVLRWWNSFREPGESWPWPATGSAQDDREPRRPRGNRGNRATREPRGNREPRGPNQDPRQPRERRGNRERFLAQTGFLSPKLDDKGRSADRLLSEGNGAAEVGVTVCITKH